MRPRRGRRPLRLPERLVARLQRLHRMEHPPPRRRRLVQTARPPARPRLLSEAERALAQRALALRLRREPIPCSRSPAAIGAAESAPFPAGPAAAGLQPRPRDSASDVGRQGGAHRPHPLPTSPAHPFLSCPVFSAACLSLVAAVRPAPPPPANGASSREQPRLPNPSPSGATPPLPAPAPPVRHCAALPPARQHYMGTGQTLSARPPAPGRPDRHSRAAARQLLRRCQLLPARLDCPPPQRLLPLALPLGKLFQGLSSARWIWGC